ncbi:MAG: outer membrane protein assembly factor BamA [Bdellovibrionales bacterium]|nr:outer membrane protein assembly factor BamA [Bdellovibrionales bacterium]
MKKIISYIIVFFLLGSLSPLWASTSLISSIEILGLKRIEIDAISSILGSSVGSTLSKQRIAQDIKRVYQTGYVNQVEVFFDDQKGVLTFLVEEKKTIVSVGFRGNVEEKTKDLEKEISVKAYTFVDREKIAQDIEKLKMYYERKGYYLVGIEPVLEEKNDHEVSLIYELEENRKVSVRKIDFVGNAVYSDKSLRKVIKTKEKSFLSFLSRGGTYFQELLELDRQLITDEYGKKGYIKVKVNNPVVELSTDRQSISITFFIEEFESFDVGSIELAGTLLEYETLARKKIELKEGETLNTLQLRSELFAIAQVYSERGYAYANVVPKFDLDEEKNLVNLVYEVSPGNKVWINEIKISGNERNRDKVIRREMQIAEGELYDSSKIRDSKQSIQRLALFENINIATPRAGSDEFVDIVISVEERDRTGSLNIGAGFNTLESFQLIGSVEKRSVFGTGADISLNARIGKRTKLFNLSYRDEHFLDSDWGLAVSAFNLDQRFTSFDLLSRGGVIGFDYPLYEKGLKRIRAGISYSLVDKDLSNLSPTVESLFADGVTSSTTLSLSRDTRNLVFEPTEGSLLKVTNEVAGTILGGDNDFNKLEFDGRWYFPFLEKKGIPFLSKTVFSFRINSGYVAPLKENGRVPLFERYFPGGIFTLRGFGLRSLGPKIKVASSTDPGSFTTGNFLIGGNKQLVFNAEYIFPIIPAANIKGVLFFDMGNAFDNGESMLTLSGQRQSVGFELRWVSPIAPLRFAWGFPLDQKEDEQWRKFDLTIGALF